MCIVQVLVDTGEHCLNIGIRLGELTRRHFADVLHFIDVTGGEAQCDGGSGK